MRLNELIAPTSPEERATCAALGGDGVVIVRGITWAQKTQLAAEDREAQVPQLLAWTIRDEDGTQLMDLESWGVFLGAHQEEALGLAEVSKRVCGYDEVEVKKS